MPDKGMLWDREDLATLRSFASAPEHARRHLPSGAEVLVERWTVRFPACEPSRLSQDTEQSYVSKPLVAPFGRALFGELAILKCLERDGWFGAWVDTYHGRGKELFWQGMPRESSPADLSIVPGLLEEYRAIVAANGKPGGFFDVIAKRGSDLLFVEYKGEGDRSNRNELAWIEAALRHGIEPGQLLFAEFSSKQS